MDINDVINLIIEITVKQVDGKINECSSLLEEAQHEDRLENINHYLYEDIKIEELKPYVLVVGAIGSGKTTYIKGARLWDHKRRYFAIQSLLDVGINIRKNADQIIHIKMLKHHEEDNINYE